MAERNLFLAGTPLMVFEAAAAARRQGTRSQLVLLDELESAARFAALLRRWRDNPFEAIVRLPGGHEAQRHGPGAQRGVAALVRRAAIRRDIRRDALAALAALDARFEPDAVWVGDDSKLEAQYALHLAGRRSGDRAGRYLDAGLHSYLGRIRARPLARRVDALARRLGYGPWTRRVAQPGTSPWIAESWLAWPSEGIDRHPVRRRHALPRSWFTGRDFRRLAVLAAREFGVRRKLLRACSVALLLPRSRLPPGNEALLLRLQRLMSAADACGRRVALVRHWRETEADPFGLLADNEALVLPGSLPMAVLLPLLPRNGLLAGAGGTALLAARWCRPDLAVREFASDAGRVRALCARHGIEPLDETALVGGGPDGASVRA